VKKKNYNSNRTFKTKLKVKVVIMERILKVSDVPFRKFLIMKEKIKAVQGPLALIKQLLIETSAILYQSYNLSVLGIVRFK
jgi:hypothetical protein